MKYLEVVRKAQKEVKKRGVYGNSKLLLYACDTWLNGDQINLWTYWQGYQYNDIDDKGIDILLVGQDWGNPDKDKETITRIEAIQSGKCDVSYNDHASITDLHLIELFQCFGCDIRKSDPDLRLFFTNYSLGYRKGSEQGNMTKTLLLEDKRFFDELVSAIKPKIIICLGQLTYEVVTEQKTKNFKGQLIKGIPFVSHFPKIGNIKVYGVAHCGALGTNNVGGMSNMIKTWNVIARDFKKTIKSI